MNPTINEETRITMHDNEARNRTMLTRMQEDPSVSDNEWFRMRKAVLIKGWDASQTELDDFVLEYEQRQKWFEQFDKRWADYKREHNMSDLVSLSSLVSID